MVYCPGGTYTSGVNDDGEILGGMSLSTVFGNCAKYWDNRGSARHVVGTAGNDGGALFQAIQILLAVMICTEILMSGVLTGIIPFLIGVHFFEGGATAQPIFFRLVPIIHILRIWHIPLVYVFAGLHLNNS